MTEFLLYFAPGALTLLVAAKLSGKENPPAYALAELLFYSGADLALMYGITLLTKEGIQAEEKTGSTTALIPVNGRMLVIGLLVALVTGVLFSFVKQWNVLARIEHNKPSLWERIDVRVKKILRLVCILCVMCLIVGVIAYPYLAEKRAKQQIANYKTTVRDTFTDVYEEVAAAVKARTPVSSLGNIESNGITVKRVSKDQHWFKGNGTSAEAVYMVDGNGTVVYFSFRDKERATTWSGPSTDEAFLAANGGWNSGNGAGWSGYSIK